MIKSIKVFYRFIWRRATGNYNMNELEKLLQKPKDKLTKRQLKIVEEYERNKVDLAKTLSSAFSALNTSMQDLNNNFRVNRL